jgi:tetratricopeptide (TPR) repeat protein
LDVFNDAIDLFNKNPNVDYSSTLNRRAICFVRLGKSSEAEQDFNSAIEMNDEWPWFFDSRAVFLFHTGRVDEAIQDMSKAIELDSTNPNYYLKRAEMFAKIGKTEKAVHDQESARKIYEAIK